MDTVDPRVVTLTPEDLLAEKKRVLLVAKALAEGGQGKVSLKPWLHHGQCWEIIRDLEANGFSVRPDTHRNTKGYFRFRYSTEGAATLRFQHRRASPGRGDSGRVQELLGQLDIPDPHTGDIGAPTRHRYLFGW